MRDTLNLLALSLGVSLALSGCSGQPFKASATARPATPAGCAMPSGFRSGNALAGQYLGLGFGATEAEALSRAQQSIAQQRYADVQSQCSERETRQRRDQQETLFSEQSCQARVKSAAPLPDVRVQERVLCPQGVWVQAVYQDLSFAQQLALLQQHQTAAEAGWPWHRHPAWYLKPTANAWLNRLEVTSHGQYWTLRLGERTRTLSTEKLVSEGLWPVLVEPQGEVSITLGGIPVTSVHAGEQYDISVKAQALAYVSLFSIEKHGRVTLISANQQLQQGGSLHWPLRASLLPGDTLTTDVWLVVQTRTPINESRFVQAAPELGLNALLQWLEAYGTAQGEGGDIASLSYRTLVVKP